MFTDELFWYLWLGMTPRNGIWYNPTTPQNCTQPTSVTEPKRRGTGPGLAEKRKNSAFANNDHACRLRRKSSGLQDDALEAVNPVYVQYKEMFELELFRFSSWTLVRSRFYFSPQFCIVSVPFSHRKWKRRFSDFWYLVE